MRQLLGSTRRPDTCHTKITVASRRQPGWRELAVAQRFPDLRSQIEATPELHPRGLRGTPIEGVVLTSGDLDQVLGLLLLRELTPLRIYSSASVRRIVREDNAFFHMLSQNPEQSKWTDIRPAAAVLAACRLVLPRRCPGRRLSALGSRGARTRTRRRRSPFLD